MPTILSRLHGLRVDARQLVAPYGCLFTVDAFVDNTHLDGPRYYCMYRVGLSEWVDAGEAETCADALENLAAALLLAKCRLNRAVSPEFFPNPPATERNFSWSAAAAKDLISAYRCADTAAQVVHARQRALGCPVPQAHVVAGGAFRAQYRGHLGPR